jgi:hypothetical protein
MRRSFSTKPAPLSVLAAIVLTNIVLINIFLAGGLCRKQLEAHTWYVKADGSGDVATIQGAVYSASSLDTILLAAGRFTGGDNKNIDYLEKTLIITSESGPLETIIDCEGEGRGFRFFNGESAASKLQGITIMNGNPEQGDGGGISCIGSSPTITDCILKYNQSPDDGGGISCEDNSSPNITTCRFIGNAAQYGGGIMCGISSSPNIVNCVIARNSAHAGGGVYFYLSNPSLVECLVVHNSANLGAGLGITNASPNIRLSTIVGNRANLFGGGCDCINSIPDLGGSSSDRNSIYHNEAGQGGANLRTNYPIDQARYVFWGRVTDTPEDSIAIASQMLISGGAWVNWWPVSVRPLMVVQKVRAMTDTLYFPEAMIALDLTSILSLGDSALSVTAWPDSLPPGTGGGRPIAKWFDISAGSALGTFSADLSLGYTQSELDASDIVAEESLYCSRYVPGEWSAVPSQVDAENNWVRCSTSQFSIWGIGGGGGPLTPVEATHHSPGLPAVCQLSQNYPNPFNASTLISFRLPRESDVSLEIYNITGARVRVLARGRFAAGSHAVVWDGTNDRGQTAGSGLYLCRLRTGRDQHIRKMMLLK